MSVLPVASEKFSSEIFTIDWDKHFGGKDQDDVTSMVQTEDGSLVIAGSRDFYSSAGSSFWVFKLDKNGNMIWEKTYKNGNSNRANVIVKTSDGGFLLAGETRFERNSDFWVIKLDKNGGMEWDKTFGGPKYDAATSAVQSSDGGYVIAGNTWSSGIGRSDVWFIKLDKNGNKKWEKFYPVSSAIPPSERYIPRDIIQTTDGYALLGWKEYYGSDEKIYWLVKLAKDGLREWDYSFDNFDRVESLCQTQDGGYVLAGHRPSIQIRGEIGWVLKLGKNGKKEWKETFRKGGYNIISSIVQTSDGDYALAGNTGPRAWFIKLERLQGGALNHN